MLCPVDTSELLADSVEGYPVHRCSRCSGVAISGNLLRDVRAYAALALHKKRDDATGCGPCPVDSKAMKMLEYKGVSMCACPQCLGLWLTSDHLVHMLELVGPPRQADLSTVVQGLTSTTTTGGTFELSNLDGLGDILELSIEVIEAIGKLAD